MNLEEFPYELTIHAQETITAREISLEWVARTLASPQRVDPHPTDPELQSAFARIPENGDRVLRVVYNQTTRPWRIVTAYFDRTQRNRL
jgi:Domain of unknown function (DUF4258)